MILALPDPPLGQYARTPQASLVQEAIGWPSGPNQETRVSTLLYRGSSHEVRADKPGKEAAPGYRKPNRNDMLPGVYENGIRLSYTPSFTDLFDTFHQLSRRGKEVTLDILGSLFARSAFLIDHAQTSGGTWRYRPPPSALEELEQSVASIDSLPPEVFLQFVEAVALNEDVKYATLGYDLSAGYGRRNNLLTCAHTIAVLLDRASFARFAGSLASRRGVAPLTQKVLPTLFPRLARRRS